LSKWPDVPSAKDLGLELTGLQAIAGSARVLGAPANIPAEIREVLEKSVWDTLQDPEFAASMQKAGYEALPTKGSDTGNTVKVIMSVLEENRDVLESLGR